MNPRFGKRRNNGVCPPSNPKRTPPPERAFCPFCPRPAVFPLPDEVPRPTRLRTWREPSAGFNS